VAIAGVLTRDRGSLLSEPDGIVPRVRELAPDLPWPLHAAHFNVPTMFVVGRHVIKTSGVRPVPDDGFSDVTDRFLELAGSLEPQQRDCLTRAIDALRMPGGFDTPGVPPPDDGPRAPGLPDITDLNTVRAAVLGRDPVLLEHVAIHARRAVAALHGFFNAIPNVRFVLVSEGVRAEAFPPDSPRIDEEKATKRERVQKRTPRYFNLLKALLGRAADLLGRMPGEHELLLRVGTLDVFDAAHGVVPLRARHLQDVVDALAPERPASVAVHADAEPLDYWSDAHGGLVLADFIANRAVRLLRCDLDLPGLTNGLVRSVAGQHGRVVSGTPKLSHVAATGWAAHCVSEARRCVTPARPPSDVKGWARGQAQDWAAYLSARCVEADAATGRPQ
jgi:hypothetical protein